jgi:hypothetical protein
MRVRATATTTVTHSDVVRQHASSLRLLSPAAKGEFDRLMALMSRRATVDVDQLGELLERGLVVPMKGVDEHRLLQALVRMIPARSRPSTRPNDAVLVRALTDGEHEVKNAFATLSQAYQRGAAITVAPEWFFVPAGAVAMTKSQRDALLQRLCALTVGSDRLLVPGTLPWIDDRGGYHNTAYALSAGKVLHSVDKQSLGGEEDFLPDHHAFVADPVRDWTFLWRDHRVSLEVCRDHGDGRARRALLGSADEGVDVQVVVSSGVWCVHHAAGEGGVILLAQGDASQSGEARIIHDQGWRDVGTGTCTEHLQLR